MVEVKSQGEDWAPHKDDAAGASHHVEDVVPHHMLYVDIKSNINYLYIFVWEGMKKYYKPFNGL